MKNMKFLSFILLGVMSTFNCLGQEVIIKNFEEKLSDLQARTNLRTDRNGNPCALVKVVLPVLEGATFEGWVIETKTYFLASIRYMSRKEQRKSNFGIQVLCLQK